MPRRDCKGGYELLVAIMLAEYVERRLVRGVDILNL